MKRQELLQNLLPAKREVKLDMFLKISVQTGHVQFVARLEIMTAINKHDKEISGLPADEDRGREQKKRLFILDTMGTSTLHFF